MKKLFVLALIAGITGIAIAEDAAPAAAAATPAATPAASTPAPKAHKMGMKKKHGMKKKAAAPAATPDAAAPAANPQ